MIDNIKHGDMFSEYIAKVCSGDVEKSGWLDPKSERVHRNYQLLVPVETGLTNGLGCTRGSERMVELTKMALCTGRTQKPAGAVRLHCGEQLSKEAMNARPLFPALVSTCLLSPAEPIYGDGRNLKVEYPPSPAPDGLQLAVADVTPPLPPFNVRVTSRGSGQ
jgi:hypothetical protein